MIVGKWRCYESHNAFRERKSKNIVSIIFRISEVSEWFSRAGNEKPWILLVRCLNKSKEKCRTSAVCCVVVALGQIASLAYLLPGLIFG